MTDRVPQIIAVLSAPPMATLQYWSASPEHFLIAISQAPVAICVALAASRACTRQVAQELGRHMLREVIRRAEKVPHRTRMIPETGLRFEVAARAESDRLVWVARGFSVSTLDHLLDHLIAAQAATVGDSWR